jgi:hypothetical protein
MNVLFFTVLSVAAGFTLGAAVALGMKAHWSPLCGLPLGGLVCCGMALAVWLVCKP